jgi:hypothetical protein
MVATTGMMMSYDHLNRRAVQSVATMKVAKEL